MGFILQLFGGFQLFRSTGEPIFLPDRAQALLAYLAVAAVPVVRQRICELFSEGGSGPEQRTALRQAVYLVRKATADDALLAFDRGLILNADLLKIDVQEFRAAIRQGDRSSLAKAVKLYHGPFLQGSISLSPAFEEWLQSERAALLDCALESLLKLAQLEKDDGVYHRALTYARRALELDPLREDAHRLAMRCLAAMNQRSSALRQYEVARHLLESELGVLPEEQTQTLYEEIAQGRSAADRTLHSADLPVSQEVEVVERHVRARLRLPSAVGLTVTFAVSVIVLGSAAWYVQHQPSPPELPSIAVMPFTDASGNLLRATSITEEITTLLTTNPGIKVIANDKLLKLTGLLRLEPDPGFRLQGSVNHSFQRLQVNVQLIDSATGTHVWADRVRAEGATINAMEEQIAYRIYESLVGFSGEIARQEQRLAWNKPEGSLRDYDYAMRGLQFALQPNKDSQLKALGTYQQGLIRFPDSTRLRIYIAFAYRRIVEAGWSENPDRDLETAWNLAVEASLSPHGSRYEQWLSHWVMAKLAQWRNADFERSVAEARAAVKMAPYDATTRADLAELMANAGKTDEAIAWLQESIRRDPLGPEWYHNNLAWAYYLAGRYEDALSELQTVNRPRWLLIAAIYVRMGRSDEARAMTARYLAELPQQTLRDEARWPLVEPLKSGWLSDLRQAGLSQ